MIVAGNGELPSTDSTIYQGKSPDHVTVCTSMVTLLTRQLHVAAVLEACQAWFADNATACGILSLSFLLY